MTDTYHSPLSPSGAHRYLRCTAAPGAATGYGSSGSIFAAEGTLMHDIADRCLKDGGDPHRFIGEKSVIDGFHVEFVKDMADCMIAPLYAVRDDFVDGQMFSEIRVDLAYPLGPGESGTTDICGIDWRKTIHVKDWKFGQGVVVEAEENEQGMLYAIGAIRQIYPALWHNDDQKVLIEIIQPRVRDGGSKWETTVGYLRKWADEVVVPKIAEIHSGVAPYTPGPKQCQWCPAKRGSPSLGIAPCRAFTNHNMNYAKSMFGDLETAIALDLVPTPTPVEALSPQQRVWMLDHANMFTGWLELLSDRVRRDLEMGNLDQAPGKKLVAGRASARSYKTGMSVAAEKIARKQIGAAALTTPTLLSPAQLEIALGKTLYDLLIDPLVEQRPGHPVIVDLSHPKPALANVRDKFAAISEESTLL